MRLETTEWVEKAEGDFRTAEREAGVTAFPNHDAACFHAQQCIEKYMKALLIENGVTFPRTHDLLALLVLATPVFPSGANLRTELAELAPYAVDVRYPGDSADAPSAKTALEYCRTLRLELRQALQIGP
jgi:HEPN domain-containing protein